MKKALMMLLFLVTVIWANAQRGHHHYPQFYGNGYYAPPPRIACPPVRFNSCNPYNRRPFINVVIAPRPRVVSNPQPQVVREWVDAHWEDGPNGRVWVEGHYVQREVY